jgi:hypothetical protein
VKASVTGDENDYIRDYNARNETFPHETTGDQYFSEEQFEVYRALGFHAVNGMLNGLDKVQSDAGLEHLNDGAAKGTGVKEAAILMGIEQKTYPDSERVDNISLVKLVPDAAQPIALQVNLQQKQITELADAMRSGRPVKRGKRT